MAGVNDVHAESIRVVEEFLDIVMSRDVSKMLAAFHVDAIYEVPFMGRTFEGPAAIERFVGAVLPVMEGLAFRDIVIRPMLEPGWVLAQYRGSARIRTTGRPYEQIYVSVFHVRDGKIAHYQEYFDMAVSAKAFALGE
jgi:ketosteroid isomerase-like protein